MCSSNRENNGRVQKRFFVSVLSLACHLIFFQAVGSMLIQGDRKSTTTIPFLIGRLTANRHLAGSNIYQVAAVEQNANDTL
jgi:hypothetical protein